MERTLDTVLKSIGNPSIASGMVSRTPSPPNANIANNATQALLSRVDQPPSPTAGATFSPTPSRTQGVAPNSPKLHSLPDNSLNPLGLLAEASLANRRAHAASSGRKWGMARPPAPMGVASDAYFKPGQQTSLILYISPYEDVSGPMTILPLRRIFIERQIQPEMLNFVSTEEVVALFEM
jgi:hypothetical protein